MLTARAIVIAATPADLRSQVGPSLVQYRWVLSLGALYRWAPNSTAIDGGSPTSTAIVPLVGGFQGAWLRQYSPDNGAPLGNADASITVDGGLWLTLPAGTLSGNHSLTLATTNATLGASLEVTRLDLSAYTLTLINGGPAAGNVCVMPASARSNALAWFDGSNFVHRRSSLML